MLCEFESIKAMFGVRKSLRTKNLFERDDFKPFYTSVTLCRLKIFNPFISFVQPSNIFFFLLHFISFTFLLSRINHYPPPLLHLLTLARPFAGTKVQKSSKENIKKKIKNELFSAVEQLSSKIINYCNFKHKQQKSYNVNQRLRQA